MLMLVKYNDDINTNLVIRIAALHNTYVLTRDIIGMSNLNSTKPICFAIPYVLV